MNLLLIALFAAFRQPGSTLLAVLVMACLLYLGVAAIFVPDNPGSWGLLGGAIAISGGAAYMTMVTCAERLRDSIRGPFLLRSPSELLSRGGRRLPSPGTSGVSPGLDVVREGDHEDQDEYERRDRRRGGGESQHELGGEPAD